MAVEYKFQGYAKNGAIKFNERGNVVQFLESVEGKPLTIVIRAVDQVRSLGWNAYYWSVIIPGVRLGLVGVGYDADELDNTVVHEYLKEKFLSKEVYSSDTNESIKITERTSKISNERFKEYCHRIQRWSMEFLHTYLPDPNEGNGLGFGD